MGSIAKFASSYVEKGAYSTDLLTLSGASINSFRPEQKGLRRVACFHPFLRRELPGNKKKALVSGEIRATVQNLLGHPVRVLQLK